MLAKAGIGAASGAASGGGVKGALMGAASSGLGGALKGIGPSGSVLNKVMTKAGDIATPGIAGGSRTSQIAGAAKDILGGLGSRNNQSESANTRTAPTSTGTTRKAGLGPTMSSFGNALTAGSRGAVKDQGFRRGYDVNIDMGEDEEGNPLTSTIQMPKITSSYAKFAKQQNPRRQAYAR
jgi:hypothetical protein